MCVFLYSFYVQPKLSFLSSLLGKTKYTISLLSGVGPGPFEQLIGCRPADLQPPQPQLALRGQTVGGGCPATLRQAGGMPPGQAAPPGPQRWQ